MKKQITSSLPLHNQLEDIKRRKNEVEVEEQLILQKALSSTNPTAIVKANTYFQELEEVKKSRYKSYIFDPYSFYNSLGYKDRTTTLTYNYLRRMAAQPVIRSIIETRKDQVAAFAEPVNDEQKAGWMVRKKKLLFEDKKVKELTHQEKTRIEDITMFLLDCGIDDGKVDRKWSADSFEGFLRKIVKDSLELDQMTFEMVFSRGRKLQEFVAVDAATFRLADIMRVLKKQYEPEIIDGYPPLYVQVYQNRVVQEFYPWELCFGIRNESTNIYNNGYGVSELEDLIGIVTYLLYGDTYNGLFFSQGAAPKGILKVVGNVSSPKLAQFRQQWQSTVAGVSNAWRTPIIESDKMEWIDLQKSNKDMEFQKWSQYLRAIACAVFKMDPSEIGFPQDGSQSQSLFSTNSEKTRLDHSRKKGLIPLLKFLQRKITKSIVEVLDENYEFVFTGVEVDDDVAKTDLDIKKLNFMTLNEIREKNNLKKIEGGDIPMNSIYLQAKQMQQMGGQESNEQVDEETGDEEGNLYKEALGMNEEGGEEKAIQSNPILDAFNKFQKERVFNI